MPEARDWEDVPMPHEWRVITSYSIHYTKLYDTGDATTVRRLTAEAVAAAAPFRAVA